MLIKIIQLPCLCFVTSFPWYPQVGDGIAPAEKEEEEEEDYFKEMNKFVESDASIDIEKLYDVLEMNLQYQDFLVKMAAEIERRLVKNKEKQVSLIIISS